MDRAVEMLSINPDLRRRLEDFARHSGIEEQEVLEFLVAQGLKHAAGLSRQSVLRETVAFRRVRNHNRKELVRRGRMVRESRPGIRTAMQSSKRASAEGVISQVQDDVHDGRRRVTEGSACHQPSGAIGRKASRTRPAVSNYDIIEKLGSGGMGTVYLARQRSLDREVAIKVLPKCIADHSCHPIRLKREGLLLARISHPNVVTCIDFCQCDGYLCVVMEYVSGPSLEKCLERRGRLSLDEALTYLKQAISGLDHANALGITHRDIKPANLLLQPIPEGQSTLPSSASHVLKVADLGLAFFAPSAVENMRLTKTGSTVGTPIYMSPEQALGEPLDLRTDIYALGVTLYLALTGKMPFDGKSAGSVLKKKFSCQFEDPRHFVAELPPTISLLIQRMTARDRENRYATYGELLDDVVNVERGIRLNASLLQRDDASMRMMPGTLKALLASGHAFADSEQGRRRPAVSSGGACVRDRFHAILQAVSRVVHGFCVVRWLRPRNGLVGRRRNSRKAHMEPRRKPAAVGRHVTRR